MAFKTSGLRILKLCLTFQMFQCLKLLVTYVSKYHWGIKAARNNLLQLIKWKQSSAIIGVLEGACIEFTQGLSCIN